MDDNIEAFEQYIKEAKKDYSVLNHSQEWKENYWKAEGDFLCGGQLSGINFSERRKSKYHDAGIVSDNNFLDWMKACVTQKAKQKKIDKHSVVHALKHIYFSLIKVKGSANTHPCYIDDSILLDIERNLKEIKYKHVFAIMSTVLTLARNLKKIGAISVGITYQNDNEELLSIENRKLAKKRKAAAAIDDNEHDGEDKCLTERAMHSIIHLYQNCELTPWERFGILAAILMFATGFRINELLHLKWDALEYQDDINETTGKQILDENGEPQIVWGLKYYPEKGARTVYKWFDKTIAPLVKSSFEELLEITQSTREHLVYLEQHSEQPILWHKEMITARELLTHFLISKTDPMKGDYIRRITFDLKKVGIKPVERIIDELFLGKNGRNRTQPVYRVADLNHHFSNKHNYNPEIQFLRGIHTITVKKSELLFVIPQGFLNKGCGKTDSKLYPEPLNYNAISRFLGATHSKKGDLASISIFNRKGLKEEDGSEITIPTHIMRHQLNAFLALADISEHLQSIIMGRVDVRQNKNYHHPRVKDKVRHQTSVGEKLTPPDKSLNVTEEEYSPLLMDLGIMPDKLSRQQNTLAFNDRDEQADFVKNAITENTVLSDLREMYADILEEEGLVSAQEFLKTHGKNCHIVTNGACSRNLDLHGCFKHLRCLQDGGCMHLMITGKPGELESIEQTFANMSSNVEKMELLIQKGILTSQRDKIALKKEKENLKRMNIVVEKARSFKGLPLFVFEDGLALNHTSGKKTVIARFAEAEVQRKAQQKELEEIA